MSVPREAPLEARSAPSLPKKKKPRQDRQYRSLGSMLRFCEGCVLRVELKTGHIYKGLLLASDDAMNVTLEDAVLLGRGDPTSEPIQGHPWKLEDRPHAPRRTSHSSRRREAPTKDSSLSSLGGVGGFSMLHVRGSNVRYIHFDDIDLHGLIRQGLERERAANRQYQRRSLTVKRAPNVAGDGPQPVVAPTGAAPLRPSTFDAGL